jgi:ABC transporter, permease protein
MLRYLLEKEFKQIRRDRFMPKIIFIIPIMQLIILPFAANFEMRNINLSIVDNDHSVTSMQLVDKVLSSGY